MSGHWTTAWLGTPWEATQAECWHFACRVWQAQFGRTVGPDFGAERQAWERAAEPREGDAVLMSTRRGHPCHIGVYVAPRRVLHAVPGSGAALTPVGRLCDLGYQVESYWRHR